MMLPALLRAPLYPCLSLLLRCASRGIAMRLGLSAGRATGATSYFIGALSVATAVFLIEEMNDPLAGIIAISSVPMRNALAILGK
jgi:hypothetical protein